MKRLAAVIASSLVASPAALASDHMEGALGLDAPAAIVGAGPTERAEVLLVNDCDTTMEVRLDMTDIEEDAGNGILTETVYLEPESSIVVSLLPIAGGDRRYKILDLNSPQGRCTAPGRRSLRAAVAIEDINGKVVRSAGLRFDGELVQAPSDKPGNKLYVGNLAWATSDDPVRVGIGQAADLVLKSHCQTELIVRYGLRVESGGHFEEPMAFQTILASGGGAVIRLPVDHTEGKWLDFVRFEYAPLLAAHGQSQAQCRHAGIDASIHVFDQSGDGTSHVAQIDRPRGFGFVDYADEEGE